MAAFTRAIAAFILVRRLGPLMTVAGMEVTVAGANPDLHDPLAFACRGVGGSTAHHSTVEDEELALIAVADLDDFMALAEWRLLLNIQGAMNAVDITAGPRSEKHSQFTEQIQKMLDDLEPTIEALGLLTAPMTASYISLDFAEHNEARL